jgi:hypothetical protein
MKLLNELTLDDFACSFGVGSEGFSQKVRALIEQTDFSYQTLTPEERNQTILDVLKKLDANAFSKVGKERKDIWSQAWSEYLEDFLSSNYSLDVLNPKFFKPDQVIRLNSEFVKPHNPRFELDFFQVFRLWLFEQYLESAENVFEFGCGSAFNLVALAQLYPDKMLYGLDWAPASVQLVNKIAEVYDFKMKGNPFDFFNPDRTLNLGQKSAVITMCALEQIGQNYQEFIHFLLEKSPSICINMEPLCELYDENNLIDYLAIRYHKQRAYLANYLSFLRELEADRKIAIQTVKRLRFGSLYSECYSFIVWEPLNVV